MAIPAGDEVAREWLAAQVTNLKRGDIEALLDAAQQVDADAAQRCEIDKASNYFHVNRERMRYSRLRERGLFVGRGVVEADCKSLVAQRLKQAGMRWKVRGAAAIISLSCQEASDRWEEIWSSCQGLCKSLQARRGDQAAVSSSDGSGSRSRPSTKWWPAKSRSS